MRSWCRMLLGLVIAGFSLGCAGEEPTAPPETELGDPASDPSAFDENTEE